ncbi:28S ribosomal protein S18b, mitochondrial isoform X1 [Syngnathoides biaculeatus]|uniref:28S ribosomal protein S18b, mitochondrial isoform X1 n=1 Tax=Syngnathoides biaculeatus TaxID=300417 RepID=UPI002ADDE20F|nr:28S ribosomal protein S18b, mitochondrial isoform X1 [Syngnathoides biaculeatus]
MSTAFQSVLRGVFRISPSIVFPLRQCQGTSVRTCPGLQPLAPQSHSFCQVVTLQDGAATKATEALSRYKERPWVYLESEEYMERYGASPVWAGYRRNHKGGIPPQKTRKTCIRGDKICGNPCPICRDSNIIIHYQNVKLLRQFISPHTGMVYDPTRTGVCMKQQKKLSKAINAAQDHGFLPFQIPYVDFAGENYSNCHDAVGITPPAPSLKSGDEWYEWYGEITPDENEVAKVRKTYKAYLKPGM